MKLFSMNKTEKILFWCLIWLAAIQAFELGLIMGIYEKVTSPEVRITEHLEFGKGGAK